MHGLVLHGFKKHERGLRMSSELQQEVAIRVNNLSKCYQIYDKPNDRLKQFVVPKVLGVLGQHSKPYFRAVMLP